MSWTNANDLPEVRFTGQLDHNCRENDDLASCDGVTDTWECRVCGRVINEPCDFEEDYS